MIFEISTKDREGNIAGMYKMNAVEASFVLNVGLNYLAANGAMPLFTGKDDEELAMVAPTPKMAQ